MKWLERKREEKREKEKQRWREAILNDQYVPPEVYDLFDQYELKEITAEMRLNIIELRCLLKELE